MHVFISWSGETSRALALVLQDWLKVVVQHSSPWMSHADLDPGKRWSIELAQQLGSSDFGIACVTTENIASPWLLFEAGALAKSLEQGRLVPLLYGLDHTQLAPPLSQFQALTVSRDDLLRLVLAIRKIPPADAVSEETTKAAFDATWASLEAKLKLLPPPRVELEPRDSDTVLGEILAIVRRLDQTTANTQHSLGGSKRIEALSWLIAEVRDVEASLVQYEASLRFFNERGSTVPDDLEKQYRVLRYRRESLIQARDALATLEQYSGGS